MQPLESQKNQAKYESKQNLEEQFYKEVPDDMQPATSQKAERRKAYKAKDPLATINHIRTILAACDLFTIEYHQTYPVPGVHCCRVLLGDGDVIALGIGSNGKGLTARYALASA